MQRPSKSIISSFPLVLSLVTLIAETATATSRLQQQAGFKVYWNVPTFMCHKYQIEFSQLWQRFNIVQNQADTFRGDEIAILYDPGAFPALLQDDSEQDDTILVRNGGVPQEGDLDFHLRKFREHLDELVPESSNFSGLGVIDMESWRPVYRQNWASLQIYRDYSLELERQRHPFWSESKAREEATRRFQAAARNFMQKSLQLASELRPRASWGYYAYPYCFNWSTNQQSDECAPQVKEENDRLSWLFGASSALYPSVYMQRKHSSKQRAGMVRGRVQEAVRVAAKSSLPSKVLAYYWFKYQDERDTYVDKQEIVNTVTEIIKAGADGLIVWGSSDDLNSKNKCEVFAKYLQNSLGPALEIARQRAAS